MSGTASPNRSGSGQGSGAATPSRSSGTHDRHHLFGGLHPQHAKHQVRHDAHLAEADLPPLNKAGHQGNYSPQERQTLDDFIKILSDAGLTNDPMIVDVDAVQREIVLGRYLRARNWQVSDAKAMFEKTLAWRKEIDIEQLMKPVDEGGFVFEEREIVAASGWKMYFHGTDKYHRPIFIQDLGDLQVNQVFEHTTPERIVKFFALNLEDAIRNKYRTCTAMARQQARDRGATDEEVARIIVDDNFMILNAYNLGMTTFWQFKNKLQELLGILDANYPDLSGRVQIINAPWLFSTIWSYIKPWLPPATANKIDIAGGEYPEILLKFIDPANLPAELGGSCKCSTPGGCPFSNKGPWQSSSKSAPQKSVPGLSNGHVLP